MLKYQDMKNIVENEKFEPFFRPPNQGKLIRGKVLNKEKSALFVDLGNFGTGIITGKEFSNAKETLKNIKIGDEISAKVVEIENDNGYVELSIAEAREEAAWHELKELKDQGESLKVKISKANKGGLIAEVRGIPAFLPVSQLNPEHYPRVEDGDQTKILKELQNFIDQELEVEIITINPKQKSLILSEKAAAMEDRKELLKNHQVGDVVEGEITSIVNFGAFIKFPINSKKAEEMIEGLIHISELDWQLIENPAEVVKPQEIVKAKIIEITNGRVSLSLKALKKDPWEGIEKKYKKGEIIQGKVNKFNPFGAFVKISPKIQGLIHISEFGTEKKMKDSLAIDQKYQFEISLIDAKEHRLILKIAKE